MGDSNPVISNNFSDWAYLRAGFGRMGRRKRALHNLPDIQKVLPFSLFGHSPAEVLEGDWPVGSE